VSKANSMSTPATGHDVSGLGDPLRYGETGISIIDKSPGMMAQQGFSLPRSKASFQLQQKFT
jgi:hypothetical protein